MKIINNSPKSIENVIFSLLSFENNLIFFSYKNTIKIKYTA